MGQGYTRNDVSNNIANGNVINASDLDGEFDSIVSAFASATGHTHDGTAAEGGAITVIGPVQDFVADANSFSPKVTGTYDLGTGSLAFDVAYLTSITLNGTAITSTAAEINILDGVTATTAEINILDGVTATTAEINKLDGVTATTTEINYIDGVTSAIQTQLDNKQPLDSDLTTIAGLSSADGNFIVGSIGGWVAESGATARTSLGLGSMATQNSTGVSITGGSIDGTTIGGTTPAAADFTTVTATTGNITTVNATTVDTTDIEVTNIDAKDGTNAATIADVTGVMTIGSSVLTTTDINGGTIDGATIGATTPAAITGTSLVADDLTVDTNTLYVDSTNNRVGIGTTSPDTQVHIESATPILSFTDNNSFTDANDRMQVRASSDNMNFQWYDDSAATTTDLMIIQSDGKVGIGTTSIDKPLHIAATEATIRLETTNTALLADEVIGSIEFFNADASGFGPNVSASIKARSVGEGGQNSDIAFFTKVPAGEGLEAEESMVLTSGGNVGLGTPSPASIVGGTDTSPVLSIGGTDGILTNGDKAGSLSFITNDGSYTGTYADGVTGEIASVAETSVGGGYGLAFYTGVTSGSNRGERMRLNMTGDLLVGKTSSATGTVGAELRANGKVVGTMDGGNHTLNRLTSDGDILRFQKDSTTVGQIGVGAGRFYFTATNGVAVQSNFFPVNANGSLRDNGMDLGIASSRWQDIFATNATIQTSDINEKQQIASLTSAELTAAKTISTLFKTFKWNDSVAEKGDAARIHTGVIAQEVEQALTDAGLDAGDYAFFISSTWWETQTDVPAVEAVDEVLDEEGNVVVEAVEGKEAYTRTDTYDTLEEAPEGATERNRKGIRYPELLSFIGAATEQRLASIEARLDALEGV